VVGQIESLLEVPHPIIGERDIGGVVGREGSRSRASQCCLKAFSEVIVIVPVRRLSDPDRVQTQMPEEGMASALEDFAFISGPHRKTYFILCAFLALNSPSCRTISYQAAMDFVEETRRHCVSCATAHDWWKALGVKADLGDPGSQALRTNVEQTELFMRNESAPSQLKKFTGALADCGDSDCLKQARRAIESCKSMVCAGPKSSRPGTLCALISRGSLVRRYLKDGKRIGIRVGPRPDATGWLFDVIFDNRQYDVYVDETKSFRGPLPNRFWASWEDIEALKGQEAVTTQRLREFLGLDRESTPSVLIGIKPSAKVDQWVPTGWDGFDHPHFRENGSSIPTGSADHHGYTLDLADSEGNRRGTREVVTRPVATKDTEALSRYE